MNHPTPKDHYTNCVHCALCLPQCPTYVELGDENDSPRGRIYLMQAVEQGRIVPSPKVQHHLDLCLNCRACETACPSGVPYGDLIEAYRTTHGIAGKANTGLVQTLIRLLTLNVFPSRRRTRRLLQIAKLARAVGLFEFLGNSGFFSRYRAALHFVEAVDQSPPSEPIPLHSTPPAAPVRARVGLFTGCVAESMLGSTNRATHRVLLRNGCEVYCPATQMCCGAIHYHAGETDQAIKLAEANIRAFEALEPKLDAIIVNVAGCGLMLKDYGDLLKGIPRLAERARRFASRVRDVHEFLVDLGFDAPELPINERVAYHEACHLCHGQGLRDQPRAILQAISGLEVVELRESDFCCGAAGSYSLTNPEMAGRLAERKLRHVDETESQLLAVANAGCILHLRQYAAMTKRHLTLAHPIDLLDRAYGLDAKSE